jgi:hypothetical protein
MLYSVTADLQKKDVSNRYMGVGIHENSELTSIEYKQTDRGSELIAFYFENELKEKLSHTEWRVMPSKDLNTMSEKESKVYFSLVAGQIRRINAIATTFISEEDFRKVKGNTFEEFCKNVIATIGDSYKGVKVRIKVVYDKRNFTALPSYTNYEWIEPMTVSREDSKIKILTNKDKMEKSAPKKLEGADEKENEIEIQSNTVVEPELAIANASPKAEDDLPF